MLVKPNDLDGQSTEISEVEIRKILQKIRESIRVSQQAEVELCKLLDKYVEE